MKPDIVLLVWWEKRFPDIQNLEHKVVKCMPSSWRGFIEIWQTEITERFQNINKQIQQPFSSGSPLEKGAGEGHKISKILM